MIDKEERLRGLLLAGLAGDKASYHAFLSDLGAHLRAYLRRRLSRAPEEVEDVLQEILLAVHNQRHTYLASQPLTAWLHAIANYKLVDAYRRRARRDLRCDALEDLPELLAAAEGEAHEARRDLAKLLQALPPRQRLPIERVKIEGLSVAEAACQLGMSDSAVKIGVHRGLKALAAKVRQSP